MMFKVTASCNLSNHWYQITANASDNRYMYYTPVGIAYDFKFYLKDKINMNKR